MEKKLVKHYLAVSPDEMNFANQTRILNETFKGETDDKVVSFPKGLGAEHPFDFAKAEKIYQNIGIMNATVDKIVDAIIGDFIIIAKDKKGNQSDNSQAILDEFIKDSNFKVKIRPWIKEAIGKGNGFMELDLDEDQIRVLNANNMYVKRNKKGKVLEFNQFLGDFKLISSGKRKPIPFKPNQIAHLCINKVPSDPYGIGLVWSNRVSIEHYAQAELSLHKLMSRKAGMPIHVKLGQPGESVQEGDITDFKTKLQYMDNSTEWVTDGNIDMKLIDFGGIGDNATKAAEHALEQIAIGMKIPMALIGTANNPEGLAKINDKGFLQFIQSTRTLIEEIIENKIFRPILLKNKMDVSVEFEWDLQGEEEKNDRLRVLKEGLSLPFISPELKAGIEREYAEVLGLDEVLRILPSPEEAAAQEEIRRKEEEELAQPEVPGAKPTANQSDEKILSKNLDTSPKIKPKKLVTEIQPRKLTESQLNEMPISEYINLTMLEEKGFNYTDYLVKILQALRTDKFEMLAASTEQEILEGLLPKRDINKLRSILKNGFRKNRTISQIEKDINQSIDLKDRLKFEDGESRITLTASARPNMIARTETVRLANEGLKRLYLENQVEQYRYLAALDDRTSDICNELNGQVFNTKDGTPGVNMPPMHANCRSTIVGVLI